MSGWWRGKLLSATGFFEQALITLGFFAGLARLQAQLIFLEPLFALGSKNRILCGAGGGLVATQGVFFFASLTIDTQGLRAPLEFGRLALALDSRLLGRFDAGFEGFQIVERPGRLGRTRSGTLLKRDGRASIELKRGVFSQDLIGCHLDSIDTTVDKALS